MSLLPKSLSGPSGFIKNTAILILGTGIAQAIPILLQPILRRVYSPEDFGAFAVYFSMIGILTVIANFRYDLAIGLPEKDEEGANLVFLSLLFNFLFNLLLLIVILLFRNNLAVLLKFPEKFSYFLLLLPFSTFLFCSFQAMNYWLIRKKAFKSLTINKVSRRGAEGIVQVTFGLFRNSSGLFWADLAGNISNNISGFRQLKKTGFRLRYFSRASMFRMLKRYIAFPKFNLVPQLLGTIAMQLPVFMINRLFTKTDLGFYDLTQQAILAPFSLISVAISQVLLQRITEKKHKGEKIFRDFMNITAMLLMIGLGSVVLIELWGPQMFALVFGNKCMIAGSYARVLIIGYMLFLVVSPMGAILLGLEKIRIFSLWNVLHFLLLIGLYFVRNITFTDFLLLFVSIEIVAFSVLYFWITKTVMKYDRQISTG